MSRSAVMSMYYSTLSFRFFVKKRTIHLQQRLQRAQTQIQQQQQQQQQYDTLCRFYSSNSGTAKNPSQISQQPQPLRQQRSTTTTTTTKIYSYEKYLSKISRLRQPSAIRRLQPLVSLPNMISLGGGLPNPNLFPITKFTLDVKIDNTSTTTKQLTLTEKELQQALQYSPTSGIPELKDLLLKLQKREHGNNDNNNNKTTRIVWDDDTMDLTITVGSQDGFCKAVEMLIDPPASTSNNDDDNDDGDNGGGDCIFLETPTYSGALSFLHPYGAKLIPVPIDEHGLIPSKLEEALRLTLGEPNNNNNNDNNNHSFRRRILYIIPTAQNPSGVTLIQERRKEIYKLAQSYDLIILEDDPYYFVHPQRHLLQSFLSMDVDGRVLRFDSVSKIISSGIRIGFVTGPKPLIDKLNLHIQATNLHNSGLSQVVLKKILLNWEEEGEENEKESLSSSSSLSLSGFDAHCQHVANFYCQRRNVMVEAASKHLSKEGLAEFAIPEAGMFLWMKLKNGITDSKTLIEEKAAKANILLVPGQSFLPQQQQPTPYVRASFSTASDQDMDTAMERLASLLRSEIPKK